MSKEVLAELSTGKKMTKAEKDERIAWKKNEVAESEATTFSIFYVNTLFLFLILCAFYFMRSFNPVLYPFLHTHTMYSENWSLYKQDTSL